MAHSAPRTAIPSLRPRGSHSRSRTSYHCRSPDCRTARATTPGRSRASTSCGRSRAGRPLLRQRSHRAALHPGQGTTKRFTTYLDFNGRGARPGCSTSSDGSRLRQRLHQLRVRSGLPRATAASTPSISRSRRLPGALCRTTTSVPGLDLAGYTPTAPIATPGPIDHEGVLIEWTDSNIANTTFEGTARELLRLQLNSAHPPARRPDRSIRPRGRGDADWRVLYVACGDGGSGDRRDSDPPQPAAARHARRQDPAHRSGPRRAHRRPAP